MVPEEPFTAAGVASADGYNLQGADGGPSSLRN